MLHDHDRTVTLSRILWPFWLKCHCCASSRGGCVIMSSSVVPVSACDASAATDGGETDCWAPVLVPPRAGRAVVGPERRGRPGTAAVAARGGPPVLAVVVGAREGRGARALLSRRSRAASRMRASLQGLPPPGDDRVVGLWRSRVGRLSPVPPPTPAPSRSCRVLETGIARERSVCISRSAAC